jgi:transglutaminase-like putative cysteine protease
MSNSSSLHHPPPASRVPAPSPHHPLTPSPYQVISPLQEALDLLPLYAAALVVTLCGIGAVNLTVDDPNMASLTVLLTAVGFGVSLMLRMLRVDPNQAMYPLLGLALFVTLQRLLSGEGLLDFVVGVRGPGNVQPDVVLASLLSWLVVLRSFALLTNYSLLFCAVPTIAMLGLTGSSNPDTEIVIYFFVFLLSTIFMVAYEHHLRLREESARAAPPSVRAHASTALALFVAVAAVGGTLTFAVRPVLSRLSPFTTPMLKKAQNFPAFNTALQNSSSYLPVGSGPISLSETPVLEVREARRAILWRARTFDFYTGRGWATRQPEDIRFPRVAAEVGFTPPSGDGVENDPYAYYYRIEFDGDPQRTQRVKPEPETEQIIVRSELPQWLPTPGRAQALICANRRVSSDAAGVVNFGQQLNGGMVYQITGDLATPSPALLRQAPPVEPGRFYEPGYLDVPLGAQRVRDLAERITRGLPDDYDRAAAIQSYIEKNCAYTLQGEPTPPSTDAVDYYLFTTKEGACDLAGTAMAIMCRAIGIPARVAVGYLEGIEDPGSGARILREADSHLWVELFFPGYGWVTFNPAPVSADAPTTPAGQVARSARRLWRSVARRGIAAMVTLGLMLVFLGAAAKPGLDLWWSTVRERQLVAALSRRGETAALISLRYRELTHLLARAGWERAPAETPAAFLTRLRGGLPAELAPVLTAAEFITDAFTRARYAEEPVPPEVLSGAETILRDLRGFMRRRKG